VLYCINIEESTSAAAVFEPSTCIFSVMSKIKKCEIQGVFEMHVITSYWLHVELGKNI
jgi:hypothetical protein